MSSEGSEKTFGYCWPTSFKVLGVPFSRGSFLSFLAFKEGMLSTPISVLGGWPTVSVRFLDAFVDCVFHGCLPPSPEKGWFMATLCDVAGIGHHRGHCIEEPISRNREDRGVL